jgi:diacylglycerol kinase (ATP)
MKKTKIVFIINPISGGISKSGLRQLIHRMVDRADNTFTIEYTTKEIGAKEIAMNAVSAKTDIVMVAGGDGTINQAVCGLIGSDTALGIIPFGSGNGLARHLKVPLRASGALALLNHYEIKKIDTVSINGKIFVNVAGMGFDAHVSHLFASSVKRGLLNYSRIALSEYARFVPEEYEIEMNGKIIHRSAFSISFANGSQWGNNAYIAPGAIISDGKMEVCIISGFRKMQMPGLVYDLFMKRIVKSSLVETLSTAEVTIRRKKPGPVHVDGEPLMMSEELNVRVNPLSLQVIIPK